jgi:hypothetical protein
VSLIPIACTLEADEARQRSRAWSSLTPHLRGVERSKDRLIAHFGPDDQAKTQLDRLVEAESQCCGFVTWELADQGDELTLIITGDEFNLEAMAESFSAWGLT